MKRLTALILLTVLLCGCSGNSSAFERAMVLREKLLRSSGYQFDVKINADYVDKVYTFQMHCELDEIGNVTFSVNSPETIAGISGRITEAGGELTFDDSALVFETLADGIITPVTAPWLLVRALRSGYIASASNETDGICIQIDDTYKDEELQLHIWTNSDDLPTSAEILWRGSRVITMYVENFAYL